MLYKGALQGAGARSVWIGDVLIGPDAVGTDSYEANRNLVLTDGARAESIPNLEIETGDIRGAGHASATGRFDDEQLFYLQARGISEDEARRLVVARLPQPRSCRGSASPPSRRSCSPPSRAELSDQEERRDDRAAVSAPSASSSRTPPIRVEVDGVAIAVVLDSNGDVHAIGDICTHGDISLAEGFVDGDTLECWAHGSAFSLLHRQAPESPRVRARPRLRRHDRRRRRAHRSPSRDPQ